MISAFLPPPATIKHNLRAVQFFDRAEIEGLGEGEGVFVRILLADLATFRDELLIHGSRSRCGGGGGDGGGSILLLLATPSAGPEVVY